MKTTTVALSPKELDAILIGLREYLCILEEGNLREVLLEMDWDMTNATLDRNATCQLIDRIHDALDGLAPD